MAPPPAQLPYKHGLTKGTVTDARGIISKPVLRLGTARSLRELNTEYAFFTPAVLYLSGFFSDAVLVDFMHELKQQVPFYHYKFSAQLFTGLVAHDGDLAWNYVLWAVPRPFWEPLQGFLCSVTLTKAERRLVIGIGYQDLQVLDPVVLQRQPIVSADTPRLEVGAFGINGNKFIFAFEPGDPLKGLPQVRRYEPAGDMGAFAEALFSGRNPADARVAHERRAAKSLTNQR